MHITPLEQTAKFPSTGARMLWSLECWGLKRIDAWGVTFIVTALALVAHQNITIQTGILVVAITANYWLGYWLNDYFDSEHDRQDELKARQNLFVQHPGAHRLVGVVAGLVFGLSVSVFSSFGWHGLVVLVLNFLVMWAYSAPPLRLKSRPGLDLLTHALFVQTWPYIICVWLTGSTWLQLDGILVGIFFLTSLNGQLNQQIRDYEVDMHTDTNFATRLGLPVTMSILKISTSFVLLLCFLAMITGSIPWLFLPLGVLALPKIGYQMLHHPGNTRRGFPRYLMYIIMVLALLYTGVLIAFS
ncbi:MAG TPA: UbiA family prenyltransferase [Anaerolineales bacterium]|jgi:chlorophyll synthase